ncbi:ATP-binding protein [Paraburkholderia tropica]|uniref:ATP-binding protein n=1 Tax=Paraburkholderia tropica TaxID=92647 RepID=UPI003018995E
MLVDTPLAPQFNVHDDGPGIPADKRELVLTRSFRDPGVSAIQGSGIGLSIVAAILRLHNFTLEIADAQPGTIMRIQCWSDVELGLSVEVLA